MTKASLILAVTTLTAFKSVYTGGASATEAVPPATVAAESTNDWSGGYVGVIVASNTADSSTGDITSSDYPPDPQYAIPGISYSSEGFSGGVEAGYNFQANNLVYGVELDASTASIDGQLDRPIDAGLGSNFTVSTKANWMASARARLGFASGQTLIYVTGGVASVSLEGHLTDNYGSGSYQLSINEIRNGTVTGAGAEVKLNQNWSLKAEYLRYDFGTVTENFVQGERRTISTDAAYAGDQARIGLNYRF